MTRTTSGPTAIIVPCGALGCHATLSRAGAFCPRHRKLLPRELLERIDRESAPGGNVRIAWQAIAEAKQRIIEIEAREQEASL